MEGDDLCGNRLIPRHENDADILAKKAFFCVFTTI